MWSNVVASFLNQLQYNHMYRIKTPVSAIGYWAHDSVWYGSQLEGCHCINFDDMCVINIWSYQTKNLTDSACHYFDVIYVSYGTEMLMQYKTANLIHNA